MKTRKARQRIKALRVSKKQKARQKQRHKGTQAREAGNLAHSQGTCLFIFQSHNLGNYRYLS